jgi:cold shock protein
MNKEKERLQGTVRWWSREKGFGWLLGNDGQTIFCHQSAIQGGRQQLTQDALVTFEIGQFKGRPTAVRVVLENASDFDCPKPQASQAKG